VLYLVGTNYVGVTFPDETVLDVWDVHAPIQMDNPMIPATGQAHYIHFLLSSLAGKFTKAQISTLDIYLHL
jgi:23S rRNA A1618 N6-methylase RlmF